MVPLEGTVVPWQACDAPDGALAKPVVLLTCLWCLWNVCGVPESCVVPLISW